MRLLFLFVHLLHFGHGIAQKRTVIIDSITKEPIPYASVFCRENNFYVMANDKGVCIFPDSINDQSITVSCAGYTTINNQSITQTIVLAPLIVSLQEVTVGGRAAEMSIDNNRKLNCSYGFTPETHSATYASYLPNTANQRGWVKELSFHVSTFHKPDLDVPMRIRFFEWDEATQLPGKEISTKNLIIKPSKKQWNKINLEKAYQDFPVNGIVIAFELLSAGPEHYHEFTYTDKNKVKHIGNYYGWNLTASCCSNCSLSGFRLFNNQWQKLNGTVTSNNWAPAVKLKMRYYQ